MAAEAAADVADAAGPDPGRGTATAAEAGAVTADAGAVPRLTTGMYHFKRTEKSEGKREGEINF